MISNLYLNFKITLVYDNFYFTIKTTLKQKFWNTFHVTLLNQAEDNLAIISAIFEVSITFSLFFTGLRINVRNISEPHFWHFFEVISPPDQNLGMSKHFAPLKRLADSLAIILSHV